MKRTSVLFFVAATVLLAASCQNKDSIVVNTTAEPVLENNIDSLSWAMGFSVAQNIASTGVEFNREILFQSICATLDGKQQPMTEKQTIWKLQQLEEKSFLNQRMVQQSASADAETREAVYFEKLLQENPNVKKSDKGFYYEVLKEGKGRRGEIGLVAVFDYKGMFTNGQIFDQTYGNREPIPHVIGEPMMPGLVEGFCLMNAGSIYRFYFPYMMAFGPNGEPDSGIPPYTTLIYEVELHDLHE